MSILMIWSKKRGMKPNQLTELEIFQSAAVLIREHGDDAPIHAAQMIDDMLDKGDMDGRDTWKRIAVAIDRLLADGPATGERVQ